MSEVLTVKVSELLDRLERLEQKHKHQGRISHALGVRTAINVIKREILDQSKADAKQRSVLSSDLQHP
jgi:hypothetical protein